MPCPILNEYLFTFDDNGTISQHREINNTMARATKKAANWIADCYLNNPDGSLACRVILGEMGPAIDTYEHGSLPGWVTENNHPLDVPTFDE